MSYRILAVCLFSVLATNTVASEGDAIRKCMTALRTVGDFTGCIPVIEVGAVALGVDADSETHRRLDEIKKQNDQILMAVGNINSKLFEMHESIERTLSAVPERAAQAGVEYDLYLDAFELFTSTTNPIRTDDIKNKLRGKIVRAQGMFGDVHSEIRYFTAVTLLAGTLVRVHEAEQLTGRIDHAYYARNGKAMNALFAECQSKLALLDAKKLEEEYRKIARTVDVFMKENGLADLADDKTEVTHIAFVGEERYIEKWKLKIRISRFSKEKVPVYGYRPFEKYFRIDSGNLVEKQNDIELLLPVKESDLKPTKRQDGVVRCQCGRLEVSFDEHLKETFASYEKLTSEVSADGYSLLLAKNLNAWAAGLSKKLSTFARPTNGKRTARVRGG